MKLLLVTDAWAPQTNGVVTTLNSVIERLPALGITPFVVHPGLFHSVGLPGYKEIPLVVNLWRLPGMIREFEPDAVHIATEGPLGMAARRFMVKRGIPFTTSLHTKFPEYFQERVGTPLAFGYRIIRWFHRPAARTLCTTASHRDELLSWGLRNLEVWSRGVDTDRFRPCQQRALRAKPRLLYVGRVSVEKNIEAFLELDINADKVIVGDGPARSELEKRFPEVSWLGFRKGESLVHEYATADVFVFPSRTDTFGLVMLEANACGTPVAAYPVTGPKDVVIQGSNGALNEDLGTAVRQALLVSRGSCRKFALENGWDRIAERFVASLEPRDSNVASGSSRLDNESSWQMQNPSRSMTGS
jgi:glycosyltransferase involved in cell wall biosynthesis